MMTILLVVILLCGESVWSLPFAAVMVWVTKLKALSIEECIGGAIIIGFFASVVYQLPFAVGVAVLLVVTYWGRNITNKANQQTTQGVIVACAGLVFFALTRHSISWQSGLFSLLHVGAVIVISRGIALRRLR